MSSNQPNHLTTEHYDRLSTALRDAALCLIDLRKQMVGQVVVPVDDIEFLARRAEQLIHACRDTLPPAERVIPS